MIWRRFWAEWMRLVISWSFFAQKELFFQLAYLV